jgi:hypothetical protein
LDGYLNLPKKDWIADQLNERDSEIEKARQVSDPIWSEINNIQNQHPSIHFNIYSGSYRDPWLGEVTIFEKDGKYWFASKRSPKLSGEMIPYKGNSFVVKWRDRSMEADAFAIFKLNENGKADGFQMKVVSPITDFSYDFQDLDFNRIP